LSTVIALGHPRIKAAWVQGLSGASTSQAKPGCQKRTFRGSIARITVRHAKHLATRHLVVNESLTPVLVRSRGRYNMTTLLACCAYAALPSSESAGHPADTDKGALLADFASLALKARRAHANNQIMGKSIAISLNAQLQGALITCRAFSIRHRRPQQRQSA